MDNLINFGTNPWKLFTIEVARMKKNGKWLDENFSDQNPSPRERVFSYLLILQGTGFYADDFLKALEATKDPKCLKIAQYLEQKVIMRAPQFRQKDGNTIRL